MNELEEKYLKVVNELIESFKIERKEAFFIHLCNLLKKYNESDKEGFLTAFNFLLYQYSTLEDSEIVDGTAEGIKIFVKALK